MCCCAATASQMGEDPYPLINALEGGGIPLALKLFQCIIAVFCVAFFVCLVPNFIVCLVEGIVYV